MKYRYRRIFLQWTPGSFLFRWLKGIRFHKYESVSLYKLLKLFLKNLHEDEILDRANGVAYNFILAVFPAIIFLFTLIPYVTVYFPEVNNDSIMSFLGDMMPSSMYDVISSTVLDILSNQRGGLLTFGFIFSLYLSTNGMLALMRAFNACYKTIEKRSVWKMRLIAGMLTVILTIVLFMAVTLLVVGQIVLDYIMSHLPDFKGLHMNDYIVYMILILRFIVIFIVFFLAISSIYYFGPAIHYNWRFFSVGSLIATLLSLAVSYGFSYYVANYSTYNKVYGSIGVLIALMVWVQLITVVLLIGYEINASIHHGVKLEALSNARKKRLAKLI
ncbi:MAG TPA: YihY/virulence factor BrkB family protein [Cyclobacteriaceae bacterium]|nr:YihY/virulence factor BrkB family protein [Cyclobacteriaceae bacterium]